MRVHAIIHASFEKIGIIQNWCRENGYQLSATLPFEGEKLPDISEVDFLIIMGGPQCAVHLDQYPYLYDEIEFIKKSIEHNKPTLGICLGAQLIGASLGANTEHSPNQEIGVFPVTLTHAGTTDPIFKAFSPTFNVMHWHSDMPGIAKDVVILAKSEGCPRQAFRYGDRVYGLQFHLEITNELLKGMVTHCADDLKNGAYIQNEEQLLAQDLTSVNEKMIPVLDYLAKLIE
ncbi:MAG: C26 family cysteine hydrolase domain-containing family [Legionellales bacterium]|nr:C26 family cysteine hydrolase domain-containing family [Legionellales bacterium]